MPGLAGFPEKWYLEVQAVIWPEETQKELWQKLLFSIQKNLLTCFQVSAKTIADIADKNQFFCR